MNQSGLAIVGEVLRKITGLQRYGSCAFMLQRYTKKMNSMHYNVNALLMYALHCEKLSNMKSKESNLIQISLILHLALIHHSKQLYPDFFEQPVRIEKFPDQIKTEEKELSMIDDSLMNYNKKGQFF